jgi:hypothetical protein
MAAAQQRCIEPEVLVPAPIFKKNRQAAVFLLLTVVDDVRTRIIGQFHDILLESS